METLNPNNLDPADPHNLQVADQPVLERIEIATEGNDCAECVTRLREPLMRLPGVQEVDANAQANAVWVTFDARKIQVAAVHEAILQSGYKAAPFADPS